MPAPTWLNVVGDIATAGAAIFAAAAIVESRRQAKKSADALLQERRVEFDVSLVERIAEIIEESDYMASRDSTLRTLLRILGPRRLPLCSAAVGIAPDDDPRCRASRETITALREKDKDGNAGKPLNRPVTLARDLLRDEVATEIDRLMTRN